MTNVNKYIDEFCTGREFMCELLSSASIRDSDLTSDPDWTYYRQHYPHQQHIVVRHIHDIYEREYTLLFPHKESLICGAESESAVVVTLIT